MTFMGALKAVKELGPVAKGIIETICHDLPQDE
jgi:hypothetical protein